MTSRYPVFLAVVALLTSALFGAIDQHRGSKADPVMERLMKVDLFAIGGVGFANATSPGEIDYRAILARPSAERDFERLFRFGDAQAKAYALVGLLQTSTERFQQLAQPLQSSTMRVQTVRGCVIFKRPMSEIIKQIRSGIYSVPPSY